VIRGDDDICGVEQAEFAQCGANASEVVVLITHRSERSRSVDAGNEDVQAIALIVLGPIGVARPEHQKKRLAALLEHGQNNACGHRGEIILLHDVGAFGSRRGHIAGNAVGPTGRGRHRQPSRL